MSVEFRPENGALFDLSARAKLRLTGADRLRYLNGQISNDARKATGAEAIYACVLSAKGRINADIFVHADGDSFLIDAEADLREPLAARLERYIIADDVQVEDVTDHFALFHVTRDAAPTAPSDASAVRANRFACPGTDLWLPVAGHDEALAELEARFPLWNDAAAEVFRIERGVSRWGRELTDEIIPTEANLEAAAIDYAKGCYIGQEVISRMKMSGQTNKRLCGLIAQSAARLEPGMRLLSSTDEAKDVGWITSVATSSRVRKQIAIGFIKRGYQEIGSLLQATRGEGTQAATAPVEIATLPFV
jgi:folate-binding protein YgfZ